MSSLSVGRGLDGLELWLAGLFSAAELAAADLLLQLSAAKAKGIDDDDAEAEAEAESSSATTSPSTRSGTQGCDSEGLTVDEEAKVEQEQEEEEEVEAEEERFADKPAASTELDRRATKRYRRLSDLYAATSPVTSDSISAAAKKKKKRKRQHHRVFSDAFVSSSVDEATRYGGDY